MLGFLLLALILIGLVQLADFFTFKSLNARYQSFNRFVTTNQINEVKINSYRQSQSIYNFILAFKEFQRRELSFSLFVEHDVASFLFYVYKFNAKAKYSHFGQDLSNLLVDCLTNEFSSTTSDPNRYFDVLWCLGKLSTDYYKLPPTFQRVLTNKVTAIDGLLLSSTSHLSTSYSHSAFSRDISRYMYSLSLMNVKWRDLDSSLKKNIFSLLSRYTSTMGEIEIVNVMYALGRCQCPWSMLPKALRQQLFVDIERIIGTCGAISLSNLLWYHFVHIFCLNGNSLFL